MGTEHESHRIEEIEKHLQQLLKHLENRTLSDGDTSSSLTDRSATQQIESSELHAKLKTLHPADLAYILEALPLEQRQHVWELIKAEHDGEILLEVSDAVRESLIATMSRDE